MFPAAFREGTDGPPRRNLLIVAGLMSLIVVLSSLEPTLAAQFTILINLATLLYLVIYAYCCAALWRSTSHWGIRLLAVLAAGFCVWAISASEQQQILYLAVVCVLGVPLYLGLAQKKRPDVASAR